MKEGDEVSLTCASDANPAANNFTLYRHLRNETVRWRIVQRKRITVTVGWDRDRFSCKARNPLGTGKSKILELQVLYKAKNVTIKGKKEVKERAALELECHFSDYNPPTTQYSYSWYLNGNPVNGETGRILQINNITESHSGTYSCNVQNRAGRSNSTGFAVTVMYSPKNVTVVISDGKKERKEDDKVRLSCLSDANPAADNFIWYKHVRNEPKKRRPEQRQNITVTVGWDRDRFSCIARNPRGPGKSKILELQVLCKYYVNFSL
uniref:Ig-like domain-containing protein n=1 Tax=Xenopus tropicalis TaxID=8364 RepID=A0A1B8Y235_XENTR